MKGEKKRRGRGRRRRVEEEVGDQAKRYGTNLGYEFLYEFPYNCMVISCTLT